MKSLFRLCGNVWDSSGGMVGEVWGFVCISWFQCVHLIAKF